MLTLPCKLLSSLKQCFSNFIYTNHLRIFLKSRFWFSRSGCAWGSTFLMSSQINANVTSSWIILQGKGPQIESFFVGGLSIHNYNWKAGFADLLNSRISDFPFKSVFLLLSLCSPFQYLVPPLTTFLLYKWKLSSLRLSFTAPPHQSIWYSCRFYTLHPYISTHLSSSLPPTSIPSRPTQPPNQANVTNLQGLLTRQI